MALITRTIPALMNGISQQPPILRSADQTEDEVNTWSHIAEGLSRRPPTQNLQAITGLSSVEPSAYTLHHINRDVNERYIVLLSGGLLRVFDMATGNEKTVHKPYGLGPVDYSGNVYAAMSIADYTFIANTRKKVLLDGVGADLTAHPTDYRFPGGTSPTDYTGSAPYVMAGDQVQYVPNTAGTMTGTVPSMDKLPDPPCTGCVYKVLGQNDTAFVSYYVMGDGTVWNETVAPGLQNALTISTMPWSLIRESDGTFTFAPFSWKHRRVGDVQSNPAPPFVGRTIKDIFFYQNRLGFAVDDGVVFSAAGDYGDFWRRTVLDYIDSDTVAASAATTDVALIDFALPYADGVMLFSRQKQFALTNADSGLSAHSLAITPVTKYVMAPGVRPAQMGSQAHFLSDARGFVSVQEYSRLSGSNPTEAADITAHVPHLIPKGASQIIPLEDLGAILILMGNATNIADRKKAYIYQFFWDADKKLQSAWRVWDWGGDGWPMTGAYESGVLNLIMVREGSGVYFEKMDLSATWLSANQDHRIYLDRQVSITGTYNAGTNLTTFTLPYTPVAATVRIVRGKGSTVPESVIDPDTYITVGTTIKVPGDESGHAATIGQIYTTKVVVSQQFPLDWQNRPLTTGRLQLHTFTANLTNTAYLRAEVYPYGLKAQELEAGLKFSQEFSPAVLWSPEMVLAERAYGSAPFTFSVASNSKEARIELINDSPFDSTITSGQWEALFFSRANA